MFFCEPNARGHIISFLLQESSAIIKETVAELPGLCLAVVIVERNKDELCNKCSLRQRSNYAIINPH